MATITPVMPDTTGPFSCTSIMSESDEVLWTDWTGPPEQDGRPIWDNAQEPRAKVHRLAGLFAVARLRRYQGYPYSVLWHENGHPGPLLWQARCSFLPFHLTGPGGLLLSLTSLPLGILRLSPQELRVLCHLGEGLAPKEIARRLGTRLPTVHTYLGRLRNKMDCEDLLGLTALACRARLGDLLREECERIW